MTLVRMIFRKYFFISSIQPGVYNVVLSGSAIRNTAKVIIAR